MAQPVGENNGPVRPGPKCLLMHASHSGLYLFTGGLEDDNANTSKAANLAAADVSSLSVCVYVCVCVRH